MKALVVTVRGLQAAVLGCYGNAWVETPAFDALAAGGVVFDNHCADAADPAGARRAWRSGRYHLTPTAAPGPDLLAELRARGVATTLIVDRSRPVPHEFEDGWDTVVRIEAGAADRPLEATFGAARAALERLAGREDWLLWLDLATLLPPWDVPDGFLEAFFPTEEPDDEEEEEEEDDEEVEEPAAAEEKSEPLTPLTDPCAGPLDPADDVLYLRIQNTYGGAIGYVDAGLGELMDLLKENNLDGAALVVVTSDIGQALGERGAVGSIGVGPHEELIHLPLLVRLPGGSEAGRRVAVLTQAVDLAPTLAEAFGATLPDAHGASLWPPLSGRTERLREYAVAVTPRGGCLRTREWAFIPSTEPGREPQLYVKPDDRWEVNDVHQHHLELTDVFEQTLREFSAAVARPGPLVAPALPKVDGGQENQPALPVRE
jgi:arylsulfatase A-like enzyme